MSFIKKIFGDANQRYIKTLEPIVANINAREKDIERMSNDELKAQTQALKERIGGGESLDGVLPDAYALVRETARRTLGQRHFDVQLMGGIVLHKGAIAEMRTGEGKTLVATLPSYLNALTGRGVHVVTVNDYLARRDAVWMGQVHHSLGLSVGCINHEKSYRYDPLYKNEKEGGAEDKERDVKGGFYIVEEFLRPVSRREAYAADITYCTNNELGFDYLRDNMVYRAEDMVQRGHNFAIVDEVDSILIDEARTPLIISAPDAESPDLYKTFAAITPNLKEGIDYKIDRKFRAVTITEEGIDKVEGMLGVFNIYEEKGVRFVHHLEQSLRAEALFHRDKDYVVRDGEVVIVDEFTGRMMPGRRWSDGLHQAVEAKEGVLVNQESRTLATITFQNYFRLYEKLSGMTGTAQSSAEEFHKVYTIDVISVPTHRKNCREDFHDLVFKTENGKFLTTVEEIKKRHEIGQPVLVGTVSIEKNERLSGLLRVAGVQHEILNAKNHEKEAEIIAQAGRLGAVTIATNMAGRGVDIILGGNPPNKEDAEAVKSVGGLHVIGTERHEARRIDNQLRGRAGRQGDPGSSQFFASLEDELMRVFGGERIKNLMTMFDFPETMPLEHSMVTKTIESAQEKIEGFNFDSRKHILEYDDVMNRQREAIYKMRRDILLHDDEEKLRQQIYDMTFAEVSRVIDMHTAEQISGEAIDRLGEIFEPLLQTDKGVIASEMQKFLSDGTTNDIVRAEIKTHLFDALKNAHEAKLQKIGPEALRNLEKAYMLQAIDMLWMDHLDTMDHLRDSVRLRAYGQRDPLVEYKNEGIRLFRDLQGAIKSAVVAAVFRIGIQQTQVHTHQPILTQTINIGSPSVSLSGGDKEVGRNDLCPCGSGKKYKKCGNLSTEEHQKLMDKK